MNLKTKLTLWSCGTVILIFTVTLISWSSAKRLLKTNEYVLHSTQIIHHALVLEKYIERLEINVRNYTIFRDKNSLKKYNEDKSILRDEINILLNSIWTPSQKDIIRNASVKIEKWIDEADNFVNSLSNKKECSVIDVDRMKTGDKYLETIRSKIQKFYMNEELLMAQRKKAEAETVNYVFTIIIYSSFAFIIIFVLISFLLSKGIRTPINQTVKIMKDIAAGSADLTKRININKNDEIGEMVNWFNVFVEKLQKLVDNLKKEARILDDHSANLSNSSTNLANDSVSNSSAIEHMNTAMEDLKQVTEVYYKNTTETLEANEKNISELMENADEATNLAQVNEINDRLKAVSEFLIDMNKQSSSMEDFIRELKEISIQSKILSVNASVQASKAGEFGKGFTVIAGEIKNLSKNSELSIDNATKTFKSVQNLSQQCALTIENIQTKLIEFINKANNYSEEFMHKTELLGTISDSINGLTVSRKKHLEGIRILAEAMNSIKDSSDNNAEGARNLESASSEITELSKRLRNDTENFKT